MTYSFDLPDDLVRADEPKWIEGHELPERVRERLWESWIESHELSALAEAVAEPRYDDELELIYADVERIATKRLRAACWVTRSEWARRVGANTVEAAATQTPLLPEAAAARRPMPPEQLVGALQDRVHRDVGRARPARTRRNRKRELGE